MTKQIDEHEIFIRNKRVNTNLKNTFVTIENQEGIYKLTKINNKIYTFTKEATNDTLHFVIEDGKHRKITLV